MFKEPKHVTVIKILFCLFPSGLLFLCVITPACFFLVLFFLPFFLSVFFFFFLCVSIPSFSSCLFSSCLIYSCLLFSGTFGCPNMDKHGPVGGADQEKDKEEVQVWWTVFSLASDNSPSSGFWRIWSMQKRNLTSFRLHQPTIPVLLHLIREHNIIIDGHQLGKLHSSIFIHFSFIKKGKNSTITVNWRPQRRRKSVNFEPSITALSEYTYLVISTFILALQTEDQVKLEKFNSDFQNWNSVSGLKLSKTYSPSVFKKKQFDAIFFESRK